MNRRNFLCTTGASLASALLCESLQAFPQRVQFMNYPDEVNALVNEQAVKLTGTSRQLWKYQSLTVTCTGTATGIAIDISAPNVSLAAVTLRWKIPTKAASAILNDQWERSYGDISWHKVSPTEILPWYFMEYTGKNTNGFGVKTSAGAFCAWHVGPGTLDLVLDTRSGGKGVLLGDRKLRAAEIVTTKNETGESAFQTTRRFAGIMCDKPRLPRQPVYGINDWYFSYGNTSEELILKHTQMMTPLAEGLSNRPFSVIDAGWFQGPPSRPNDCCWGDRMDAPNTKFGDMAALAEKIRQLGMRPGIWTRPLCGSHKDPTSLMLPVIPGREASQPVLDPTIPENLERVKKYFELYNQWSFEIVKFDFTTFDIFGKWGFEMVKDGAMSSPGWSMNDTSRTNAEIVLNLYKTIWEASDKTYVIGCNTISHLAAGLFEVNRIGDDTSGQDWDRTRKMGVNTLAFRGLQHGIFYAADGDCVGLTTKVPWAKNKQWMELIAKSGTPLFISAQPDATGSEQKAVIKDCFRLASQELPVGEPLDWMEKPWPERWKLNGKVERFDWNL